MDDTWSPSSGGSDAASIIRYGLDDPFDDPWFRSQHESPEQDAAWAALTLKQKIVGSVCSIAVGAAGAGLLIALVQFLH